MYTMCSIGPYSPPQVCQQQLLGLVLNLAAAACCMMLPASRALCKASSSCSLPLPMQSEASSGLLWAAGPGSATAAGLVPFSVGTETGGSITFPADTNGISALRPSFGLVGRSWVMSLAESLVSRPNRRICDAHCVLLFHRCAMVHRLDHEPYTRSGERFSPVQGSVAAGASWGLLSFSRQMAHKVDIKLAVAASAAT